MREHNYVEESVIISRELQFSPREIVRKIMLISNFYQTLQKPKEQRDKKLLLL
jgi:hypothetical protein